MRSTVPGTSGEMHGPLPKGVVREKPQDAGLAPIRDGCCHTSIERITRLWGNRTAELGGSFPSTATSAIRYSGCVMDTAKWAHRNPSTYHVIDPGSQSTP